MRNLRDRNEGFTILELILAAALGVVVLGGAYMVYEAGWSTVGRSERKADLQQNTRVALDTLAWQIRHAGYQSPNWNLGTWPDWIVIGTPNLLVVRGDVLVTGTLVLPAPLADTLFGLQPAGTGQCPNPPSAYPLPACLVTGTNVYTVAAANTVVAFNAITGLNFNYFDGNDNPLLAPLDGVTNIAAPPPVNPIPGPLTDRRNVKKIQIVLTAADLNVSAGPGIGSEVEQIALTAEVRLRNTGD